MANLRDGAQAAYRLPLAQPDSWSVVLCTADPRFGGDGPLPEPRAVDAAHVELDLPPRSVTFLARAGRGRA